MFRIVLYLVCTGDRYRDPSHINLRMTEKPTTNGGFRTTNPEMEIKFIPPCLVR